MTKKEKNYCIVPGDEERICPDDRSKCPRQCPYVGWEQRNLEVKKMKKSVSEDVLFLCESLGNSRQSTKEGDKNLKRMKHHAELMAKYMKDGMSKEDASKKAYRVIIGAERDESLLGNSRQHDIAHKGYIIRKSPFRDDVWIEKDGHNISSAKDIENAKEIIDDLTKKDERLYRMREPGES